MLPFVVWSSMDLDELLYPVSPRPWSKVAQGFREMEEQGWDKEEYLVEAIKKYLRDDEDKKLLFDLDLSIEDCLNGRYGAKEEKQVHSLFVKWNKKLGFQAFGN